MRSCDKQLVYSKVSQHIAGARHRERVMVSREVDSFEGDDSSVEGRDPASGDETVVDSQNALPVRDGLFVVNGFDVVKYIRGLEGRISELERKLEAANAATSTENDTIV